jgi:hypothetical protein
MKQLFKIDESEKRRIIEMHENATKRNYLSEQGQATAPAATTQTASQREPFTSANGVKYKLPLITSDEILTKFINPNNGGINDANFLSTLGLKGLPEGKVDEMNRGNSTVQIYRLLREYLDAAAQLVGKNSILCGDFKNIAALDQTAQKGQDYTGTFSLLGGGNIQNGKSIFDKAVGKLLQIQTNSLGGCNS